MGKLKKYQKIAHRWTEEDVNNALQAVRNGDSIRSSAKRYGMTESMLQTQIVKIKEGWKGNLILSLL